VDLSPFDRVVSSSHAFGHHLASRAAAEGRRAYAYVHTPARYVWSPELDERGQSRAVRVLAAALKVQDRRHATQRVSYAANSHYVRDRIRAAWDQDAVVIYPPVSVERIQSVDDWADKVTGEEADVLAALPQAFVLGASRLIEYKRLDLAMRAGEALGLPVVIAGTGPYETVLREQAEAASVPVTFVGRVSDEMLYALYQRAELFVFMAIEDFGIMPVEAMACGTPVLVNSVGGASESARLAGGGVAVAGGAYSRDVRTAASQAVELDRRLMREGVQQFSEAAFRKRIAAWVR
jgi:glycosyltransferase involved in cell wall biosynthesis